jgi:hypothetical protein
MLMNDCEHIKYLKHVFFEENIFLWSYVWDRKQQPSWIDGKWHLHM